MTSKKVNFSAIEKELIIRFVEENKGVVENKSGDIMSVKHRRDKWQELEGIFLDSGFQRDWHQLRNAYQKMKVHAKHAISGFTKCSEGDASPINTPSREDWRIMEITPSDFKVEPPASMLEPEIQINRLKRKPKNVYEEEIAKFYPEQIRRKIDRDEEMHQIIKNHTLLKNELEITKMKLDIDVVRLQKEKLELEIFNFRK